jgi:hypothetical protein
VTQIGQSLSDIPISAVERIFRHIISSTTHSKQLTSVIDRLAFAAHYPYPQQGRQYAIGMQKSTFFTTLVHTTHFASPGGEEKDDLFCRSKCSLLPIYRVMLWRNNPFHIYTGFVEAGFSTGLPSEPNRAGGIEHPMWLLCSHSPLSSLRSAPLSTGYIDNYFDMVIPQYNLAIRSLCKGDTFANIMYSIDEEKGIEAFYEGPGKGGSSGHHQQYGMVTH